MDMTNAQGDLRMECKMYQPSPDMSQWGTINWKKANRYVFKLQKRIYNAELRGDLKAVRKLQKTLLRSWSAKLLAVRKVTQDNQGRHTAGIDGIKSVKPEGRIKLAKSLKIDRKAKPVRRVWIPKPRKSEKRPLGIPTMQDRALQALVKMALEPQWEARFEPNSFGFRPGKSAHDAIQAIRVGLRAHSKYVLDADIAKCFDRIDHDALLKKLDTFPTVKNQVKAWLKAGVMDKGGLAETEMGTPQGGVISPLLANIALHGMEKAINKAYPIKSHSQIGGARNKVIFVRYADDFVALHEDLEVIKGVKQIMADWLKGIGLELSETKTKIVHTLNEYEGNKAGFDFLGFNVRQYPCGKYRSGKLQGRIEQYKYHREQKTIIKPSEDSIKRHLEHIRGIIKKHTASKTEVLIGELRPIIKGWTNYYSTVNSGETFGKINYLLFQKLWAWAKRRHPNKGKGWVYHKYWRKVGGAVSLVSTSDDKVTARLCLHSETPILQYTQVKREASPYDGNWVYWSRRLGKYPLTPNRVAKLLQIQKGKCALCGQYITELDVTEVDHIQPKSQQGKDKWKNLRLLHRHCHVQRTSNEGQYSNKWEH
jgi:RNA-directed DNA polymerase